MRPHAPPPASARSTTPPGQAFRHRDHARKATAPHLRRRSHRQDAAYGRCFHRSNPFRCRHDRLRSRQRPSAATHPGHETRRPLPDPDRHQAPARLPAAGAHAAPKARPTHQCATAPPTPLHHARVCATAPAPQHQTRPCSTSPTSAQPAPAAQADNPPAHRPKAAATNRQIRPTRQAAATAQPFPPLTRPARTPHPSHDSSRRCWQTHHCPQNSRTSLCPRENPAPPRPGWPTPTPRSPT